LTATEQPPPPPPGAPPGVDDEGVMTSAQWLRAGLVIALIVLLTAKLGVWALVVLAGLLVSVTLHELGHFLAAKRAGMKVTEFFLGFGPRIWSTRRGETEYGLKLIPAGAYVRIIGMNNLEEVPSEDEGRTYRQGRFGPRLLTVVAGVAMNALIALILIWVMLAVLGVPGGKLLSTPELPTNVHRVFKGGPADAAGLQAGDRIVTVDGVRVDDFNAVRAEVQPRMGETFAIGFIRDGRRQSTDVTAGRYPTPGGGNGCGLGVEAQALSRDRERTNPIVAVPKSAWELGHFTGLTLQGLGRFFSPSGLSDYSRQVANGGDTHAPTTKCVPVAGKAATSSGTDAPNRLLSLVGLFQLGTDAPNAEALVFLFATLNLTLAVINMVPLLPFDGGHVAIAVYERVQELRRRMQGRYFADVARLLPLTYFVVLLLFLLFVSSIYLDITSPITD
jgi:membrane-associated protease RseP (regulator of RpoE activity)